MHRESEGEAKGNQAPGRQGSVSSSALAPGIQYLTRQELLQKFGAQHCQEPFVFIEYADHYLVKL
jgi:hypothetical protein